MVQTQHHTGKHRLREGCTLTQAHKAEGPDWKKQLPGPQAKALSATQCILLNTPSGARRGFLEGISRSWIQPRGLSLCSYAKILCLYTSLVSSLCFLGARRLCLEVSEDQLPTLPKRGFQFCSSLGFSDLPALCSFHSCLGAGIHTISLLGE